MPRTPQQPSAVRRALRLGVALLGADLGLRLGSRTRVAVGPVVAEARVTPAPQGGVDVHVPPVGDARLATHRGLLHVDATVTGVDEQRARTLLTGGGKLDLDVRRELRTVLVALGTRAAAGAVAGAAAAAGLTERSVKQALIGGATGGAALAANAAIAYGTLRTDAWKTPALSGLLSRAPAVIGDVRRIPERLDRYRTQLGEITASVTGIYRGLTSLPSGPPSDAIKIVWLSDVHNNPLAFSVARSLVEQYGAALVVDTGDIADWGTAQEARTFAEIAQLPVPYLFVKGNHDGPPTLDELAKLDNVVILDGGEPIEQAGVRIVGDADPRFTPDKSTGDDAFPKSRLAEIGAALAAKIAPAHADLALVHDPVVAAQLGGAVPLVLCGHTHKRNDRLVDGTLVLTQGSSGGVGLRGVRNDPPEPLTISVLHVDAGTKRLHTVDELTLGGLGLTEVALVRRPASDLGAARAARAK
ncbi:metallophosphoesterase family protein [Cumulibacter manganitolerans]|uniref:metallophosphoesterase family protein n=1 Tax=Cumulibacter manganitolerans TaxID=1884992 RepID=UPI001885DEEE|nr:metallophosphoesterase family protein [Cumulibacter manganitolerans]